MAVSSLLEQLVDLVVGAGENARLRLLPAWRAREHLLEQLRDSSFTVSFILSRTRPSVVRLSNSTTRMTRRATSARYIDSFSPWWKSELKSVSPISLRELVVGAEIGRGERGERRGVELRLLADRRRAAARCGPRAGRSARCSRAASAPCRAAWRLRLRVSVQLDRADSHACRVPVGSCTPNVRPTSSRPGPRGPGRSSHRPRTPDHRPPAVHARSGSPARPGASCRWTYSAVASPSRLGLVARITSRTSPSSTRCTSCRS